LGLEVRKFRVDFTTVLIKQAEEVTSGGDDAGSKDRLYLDDDETTTHTYYLPSNFLNLN
jgi:hypothetical protein